MRRNVVPRKPRSPDGLAQFNIRMPPDLIDALDREVAEEQEQHPGRMLTRSDLIREILYAHVRAREAAKVPRRGKS